ncbi:MAG TPA: GTPase Era [Vicinamibacteria bacterium]|nr:GTPase Era [Vicinamibacteria bacterium]
MSGGGSSPFRAGFVTVVGRPNVGKSTLVNRLVGQKVAIVSDKPQTTRNRILAVVNRPGAQLVLLDTPGIHKPMHEMNRRMVATATKSIGQGDVVLWLAEVEEPPGPGDRFIEGLLRRSALPVVLGLNKIDRVRKPRILPAIEAWRHAADFAEIVPVSALTGENVDRLEGVLRRRIPEGPALYPEDFLTDLPERFFVAEMVRERVLEHTREEIPYVTGVVVESFREEEGLVRIQASILVERENQKGILIGRGGSMLKAVGTEARREIEAFLGAKVFLGLFVKVRESWRENRAVLAEMGLGDSERGRAGPVPRDD